MTNEEIERSITSYLIDSGVPQEALSTGEKLFTQGYLDSLQIVQLVVFLEDKFRIRVAPLEISVEHFDMLPSLVAFVASRTRL